MLSAARTGNLQPAVMQHPDLRRHDVELLGGFLAHHFQARAVVRADLVGLNQVMDYLFARQVRWQRAAMTACTGVASNRRDGSAVFLRLHRGVDFGLIEQAQLRTVAFDPLALRTKALCQQ